MRVRDGIVTLAEEGLVDVFVADAHRGIGRDLEVQQVATSQGRHSSLGRGNEGGMSEPCCFSGRLDDALSW